MGRKSVLLVSLLLLLAGVGGPATAGVVEQTGEQHPVVVSVNDTSNYLALPDDDVVRQDTSRNDLSLGTAIDTDTSALQSDVLRIKFRQEFNQAADDSEKTAVVTDAADRVERHKRSLERQNRQAIRAYASGSMSAAEFSRERARISQEAQAYQRTIERVERIAAADASYSLSTRMEERLANIAGELEALQGEVSTSTSQAASGEEPGQTLYVEASETGYTMAYVDDGLYFRETYLGADRDANATDQFTQRDVPREVAAQLRGYELYPWLVNNSVSPNLHGFGTSGIYRFSAGETRAYIDGGTTDVFREFQRQKLSAMPISNTVTNENDSLRLRLNKTYETGPLEVSLHDNETGEPVNGTVLVDGDRTGHTGDDGRLWIVEPRGPDRIEATTEAGRNVSVFIPS